MIKKKILGTISEIQKSLSNLKEDKQEDVKITFEISKAADDRQIAFGFAMFSELANGEEVIDTQDDSITEEDLEDMAYWYMLNGRDVGQMHETSGEGAVVESMVFTKQKMKQLGIPEGTLPVAWWVGLWIKDPEVWKLVKDGTYKAFSIQGKADREVVDEEE